MIDPLAEPRAKRLERRPWSRLAAEVRGVAGGAIAGTPCVRPHSATPRALSEPPCNPAPRVGRDTSCHPTHPKSGAAP